VNIAAPEAVPQAEFARALGAQLGRPAVVPTPAFAIRLGLGEMGEELLLNSTRVRPDALIGSGFTFDHGELAEALDALYADRSAVEVRVAVDAGIEEVWAELEQIEQHTEWMRDATAIRFVGDSRRGAGTTFECDTRVGPLTTTDVMEITAWEPGERMAVEHRGAVSGSGEFTLHPLGEGRTEIRWSEDLRFPWYFGGPAGARGSRPILRRLWQGNLRRLAERID
jgi:uncharacterized protein YndB with AHSA1/START domain